MESPVKEKIDVLLTEKEVHTLREALDSHLYWQVSQEHERRDGHVIYPKPSHPDFKMGSLEDQERWTELAEVEALIDRLDELVLTKGHDADAYKKHCERIASQHKS